MSDKHIIIDWCSEFKGLDEKLSLEYGVIITGNERMEASVTGANNKLVRFLTSVDYGKSIVEVRNEFPELNAIIMNAMYTFGGDKTNCSLIEKHTNGYCTIQMANGEEKIVHYSYVTEVEENTMKQLIKINGNGI